MQNLSKLFKLIEYTRNQIQYGYILSGVNKTEISDLSQHHYLVTFIAWQLARQCNLSGAKLNIEKVLEFSLIHDLGELFGGDISRPYAVVNPTARQAAKKFEAENQSFIADFFGPDSKHFKELSAEIMDAKTDESIVAKIADYLECALYLVHIRKFKDLDYKILTDKIPVWIGQIKDKKCQECLKSTLENVFKDLNDPNYRDKVIGEIIND